MTDPTNLPALPDSVAMLPVLTQDLPQIIGVLQENLGASKLSQRDLDKIKVPAQGGTLWTIQTLDGEQAVKELTGVICYVESGRGYWEGDDAGNVPPNCSSSDTIHGYGKRGADDTDGPHDCASCPMNQFGSAMKNGKPTAGKACGERKHLFLLMGTGMLPQVVQIPGTSLKNWSKYIARLSSNAVPYSGVVTKLSLSATKNKAGTAYSEVVFTSAGLLPKEYQARIKAYAETFKASFQAAARPQYEDEGLGDAHDAPPPFEDANGAQE